MGSTCVLGGRGRFGGGSGSGSGLMLGGGRRRWIRLLGSWFIATTPEVPGALQDTKTQIGEESEEAPGEIETAIGTARALIDNCSSSRLAIDRDDDLGTAVWTRIATSEHGGIQRNDKGTSWISTATSGNPDVDVIESESC